MGDKLISQIKCRLIQKTPVFYEFLRYTLGAVFVGKDVKDVVKKMPSGSLIINLGSGAKRIGDGVKNIDIAPSKRVDIVADARKLSFEDESVDLVIAEQLLEHVSDPQVILKEACRVLRPGGMIYISTPFILGYHSMPGDYYRWTLEGLRELLKDFKEVESGMRCGPTSALVAVLSEWLASFFSFGIRPVHQIFLPIFMLVLAPLKILDFFIYKYRTFENIALAFYYIGRK